jgi:hypothetical protein
MKTKLSIWLLLILFCGTATCLVAQNRTSKEIPGLVKKLPRTEAFHFATFGFGWKSVSYEFVSLKDLPSDQLNETEKKLLNIFSDAAFCFKGSNVHCCYWVKDSVENLGLVKFDGSILVPPLKGNILQGTHPDRIFIGEQTVNPADWLEEYHERVTKFSGIGLGHFNAVVDDVKNEDKIRATIPAGKYDDIMLGIKGAHTFYFVAKIIDGEMKWGVVDKDDEEVLPIQSKGIYKKKGAASWLYGNVGGKWVASDTKDMSQIENMVRNEEMMAEQRKQQLAETLLTLGNTLQQAAVVVDQIQQTTGGGESSDVSGSSVGGTLESQYKQWEKRAKANYNSLTNLGVQVKDKGKDVSGTTGQSMSSSNYTMQKKSLREAQNEMKKIREKASKQGIKIAKSEYEDVVVKF